MNLVLMKKKNKFQFVEQIAIAAARLGGGFFNTTINHLPTEFAESVGFSMQPANLRPLCEDST